MINDREKMTNDFSSLMFQRPPESYRIDYSCISAQQFLEDRSNPLAAIVELVPDGAKVLDVGAGNGFLGWLFREIKPSVIIDGVEPSEAGGALAQSYYRTFYKRYVQDILDEITEVYDYIILADVIEHVVDPMIFMLQLTQRLTVKTRIVMSVPNVAHYSARLELLNGSFRYRDSGLLEKTHLRFFVSDSLEELVSRLGWSIERFYYLQRLMPFPSVNKLYFPGIITMLRILLDRQALTYQYLVVLRHDKVERQVFCMGAFPVRRIGSYLWRKFRDLGFS